MNIVNYALRVSGENMTGLLLWLGGCAAALLVIVGLVALSILLRKKQKKNDTSA